MAPVAGLKMSLEAFHARYDGEKPYFEYWDGEAVQKAMPTSIHALVQTILVMMLNSLGFRASQEVTLKLVQNYQPVPDVIANEGRIEFPYPTKPFEVAIEILSPGDQFSRVLRKCRMYEQWGIRQVVLVDPQDRVVWSCVNGVPDETDTIARRGETTITAAALWAELDRQMEE